MYTHKCAVLDDKYCNAPFFMTDDNRSLSFMSEFCRRSNRKDADFYYSTAVVSVYEIDFLTEPSVLDISCQVSLMSAFAYIAQNGEIDR